MSTLVAVLQADVKRGWAARGAGAHLGLSLGMLSHGWGPASPRSTCWGEDDMAGHASCSC